MLTEYGGAPVDGGTIPALIFNEIVHAYDAAEGLREGAPRAERVDHVDDPDDDRPSASDDRPPPPPRPPPPRSRAAPAQQPAQQAPQQAPAPRAPAPSGGGVALRRRPGTGGVSG